MAVTSAFGCRPTFPATAVVVRRHAGLIRRLAEKGAEIAIHGYIHADYKSLPPEQQKLHFDKAIRSFKRDNIPFVGFRAPYLRANGATMQAVGQLGFAYDSSQTIWWDVLDRSRYTERTWSAYQQLLDFYQPRDAAACLSLPKLTSGLVEIPVSIPDDEAMVDRLGIRDKEELARIWRAMLQQIYARGELFTLQLHHERIWLCDRALICVLRFARQLTPPIWVASLGEVAEWWRERHGFAFTVTQRDDGRYAVVSKCSERATILLKNCGVNVPILQGSNGFDRVHARSFVVDADRRPVIGVAPGSSRLAVDFLNDEGFPVEESTHPDRFGLYLDDLTHFEESDSKALHDRIEKSNTPLLRFGRWPDGARAALSVTGDVDSITLWDFGLRVLEVWRQNGRGNHQ